MSWPTAGTVDAAAGKGWPGLWAVLFTAERAVMALVQATSFAEGLDLIWLAEDLTDACEDIRVRHPGEVSDATAADLGPLPAGGDLDSARQTVAHLISSAIRRIDELSVVTTDPPALLWLAGSGTSLFAARTRLVTAGVR